jgi:hypothetical protein
MDKLNNWLFNYCSTTNLWRAVKRDESHLMFNDYLNPNVLKSTEITTLIELIVKEKW